MEAAHAQLSNEAQSSGIEQELKKGAEKMNTLEMFEFIVGIEEDIFGVKQDIMALKNTMESDPEDRELALKIIAKLENKIKKLELILQKLETIRNQKHEADRVSAKEKTALHAAN